jgi:hypothetical protein
MTFYRGLGTSATGKTKKTRLSSLLFAYDTAKLHEMNADLSHSPSRRRHVHNKQTMFER